MKEQKTITNKEYEDKMLKELGLSASDLTTTSASVEKSRKAKAKELAHNEAIKQLENDKENGKMKYVLAIGLKNKKPQKLNGKYFVIDNVTNDKGQKGSLVLEYKSYFENTFVTKYPELGE